MDPPALINNGSFQSSANEASSATAAFNLPEIWPFGESGGGLDLMRVQFGQRLGQIVSNADLNREVPDDDPMISDQRGRETIVNNGGARKRRDSDESAKVMSTSTANGMNDCDGKRLKSSDKNCDSKTELEASSSKPLEENKKPADPPKQDYIHVRARRGQATDSHSLAERARREKISERMKTLQDIVPGCNKVIGKALVLDEIINYIQSLQRQVEFLSMKLEAVNSRSSPDIEGFPSKDFSQQTFDTAGAAFGSQATRDYGNGSSPDQWLHMQIGGNFQRT